jgi:2-acylglycerol O-acyltransferase 2
MFGCTKIKFKYVCNIFTALDGRVHQRYSFIVLVKKMCIRHGIAQVTLFALFGYVALLPFLFLALLWFTLIKNNYIAWIVGSVCFSSTFYCALAPARAFDFANSAMRRFPLWSLWCDYFSFRVLRDGGEEFRYDHRKSYMIAIYPHGLFPFAPLLLAGSEHQYCEHFPEFSTRTFSCAVATIFMRIPLLCLLFRWLGAHAAGGNEIRAALSKRGHVLFLLPGGIAEVFLSDSSTTAPEKVYFSRRQGFLRQAMDAGAEIVPAYAFGHTAVLDRIPVAAGLDSWLCRWSRKLRVSLIWFRGVAWSPLPRSRPITLVLGRPLFFPRKHSVELAHRTFMEEIQGLYEKYHAQMPGYEQRKFQAITL